MSSDDIRGTSLISVSTTTALGDLAKKKMHMVCQTMKEHRGTSVEQDLGFIEDDGKLYEVVIIIRELRQ